VNRGRLRRWLRRGAVGALTIAAIYVIAAYLILPRVWAHYEHEPGLAGRRMLTVTAEGIPGDPLNVGLVGSKEEAIRALAAAGWYPADPITLETSIAIAGSVIFDRPYRHAPVSPLFYDGRSQDFAFEKPAGESADRRHHVRFWKILENGDDGRPVFLGSASFDRGAGVSHYTGEITHHIGPDIDAERDFLIADLVSAKMLTEIFHVTGIGPTLQGRNGGGDRYFTDGEITLGTLSPDAKPAIEAPTILPDPMPVAAKNAIWNAGRRLFYGQPPQQPAQIRP
jgi:hypothetical protein